MRKSFMIKEFCLSAIVLAAMLGIVTYPKNAAAVTLKETSVVATDTIMLSDVFRGLPDGKDKALGPAPRPGQDMTLNARTLLRVARALNLSWRPAHSGEYIVLSRAATIVDSGMIEDALNARIEDDGYKGEYKLAFAGALGEMILPPDMEANVEVQSINLRQEKNRFEATLVAPSREEPIKTIRVSGSIHRMIDVPVLNNTLRKGTIIGARDIDMISIRESDVRGDLVIHADELIGKTPRRVALSGKALKINDFEEPLVVERGDTVTMIFDDGGMRLTAKGKALENGAKGDFVRVSNSASSRTVEALVTAQREVLVKKY